MNWLPWAPLVAATLHITDEFVFPGGFPAWYRAYRKDASRVTPRFLFWINAGLLVTCLEIGLMGRIPIGAGLWLLIMTSLGSNGIWHAWASYRLRQYSPGTITGILLYVPLAIYGYCRFLGTGEVSIGVAAIAFVIGASYHIWSAAYHRGQKLSP